MGRRWAAVAVLAFTGCSFESPGSGGGAMLGMSDSGTSAGDDDALDDGGPDDSADGTTSMASSGGVDTGLPGSETSVDPGTDDGPAGEAQIVFVEAPMHDVGDVPGAGTLITVTLHNTGMGPATAIEAGKVDAPFSWDGGGEFPGASGTCGASLEAGAMCTAVLATIPNLPGRYLRTLDVAYETGAGPAMVSLDYAAGLMGDSANLLQNPGAEGGVGLPGWVVDSGGWYARAAGDQCSGSASIFAGPPNGAIPQMLHQNVPVGGWAEPLANGNFGFAVGGVTRAYAPGNDPHWFQLRFVDGSGGQLGLAVGSALSPTSCVGFAGQANAMAATATVRYELVCQYVTGEACSAWFDDLSLVARYPVPPS